MTDFSMICDYSYSDKYTGVFNSINSYGNTPMYVYLGTGFTFTDYIRFDYTEADAYSQKLLNIPVKGISGSFSGISKITSAVRHSVNESPTLPAVSRMHKHAL